MQQQEARDAAVLYFKQQPSKAADEFVLCLAFLVLFCLLYFWTYILISEHFYNIRPAANK
jgi:hypothetical protein